MRHKRKSVTECTEEPVQMALFPQYDLTKDVRFELMNKVFGSVHLHKRHIFLNKDTQREFRANDRQKKLFEIECSRQKQKVATHFLKLLNSSSHVPTEDLRYSYNNWTKHFGPPKPTNKQTENDKTTLECTVICEDGKEIYVPPSKEKSKEHPFKRQKSKINKKQTNYTRFPLFRQFTM